ncbi:MAG: UDP-2,3-diacylglucosamine diphosphatase [Alphaproteobacteria bacterium]
MPEPRRVRTIFISDVHLGTRGCKAGDLLDFLRAHEAETLYLVGDIIDGWRLKRAWYWNTCHEAVIREILRKASNGTRVIYIPGNHDEILRGFLEEGAGGQEFGGIVFRLDDIHELADGRRFLVTHGDHYDDFLRYGRLACLLGGWAYSSTLRVNDMLNWLRSRFGRNYWSLSDYLKTRLKNAARFIRKFEVTLAGEARSRGLDGVVCGHIHHAAVQTIGGVTYCNSGDWVESCTALVETLTGEIGIVRWNRVQRQAAGAAGMPAAA